MASDRLNVHLYLTPTFAGPGSAVEIRATERKMMHESVIPHIRAQQERNFQVYNSRSFDPAKDIRPRAMYLTDGEKTRSTWLSKTAFSTSVDWWWIAILVLTDSRKWQVWSFSQWISILGSPFSLTKSSPTNISQLTWRISKSAHVSLYIRFSEP